MPTIAERIDYRAKRAWEKSNKKLGRICFGNTTRFSLNLAGPARELKARTQTWPPIGRTTDPRTNQFRKNGWAALGQIHSAKTIAGIKRDFKAALADETLHEKPGASKHLVGYTLHVSNPLETIPGISSLMTNEMIKFIQSYYRSNFSLISIAAFRNLHVPDKIADTEKEAFSNHWHFDNLPTDEIGYWVLLSDVTEQDGPTHLHTIDNSAEMLRQGFGSRSDYGLSDSILENREYLVRFCGPAGSAFMHRHPVAMHRAGIPGPGRKRDTILIRFRASARMELPGLANAG